MMYAMGEPAKKGSTVQPGRLIPFPCETRKWGSHSNLLGKKGSAERRRDVPCVVGIP